jgi:hypothetical protein
VSLFDFPRIHVWGTTWINPSTANNDSVSPGLELTVTTNTERVHALTQGKSDAEFRAYMTGLDQFGLLRCQWNYYGDFSWRFVDVRVRSAQFAPDHLVTDPAVDPLIGGQVYLNDLLMVDTNPEGFTSTQIFAESLEIRAPGAFGGTGTFISRKPTRATTRGLNWYRNVSYHGLFGLPPTGADGQLSSGGAGGASTTFQHGIPVARHDLKAGRHAIDDQDEVLHKLLPGSSGAVAALRKALQSRRALGLTFRYNLYLSFPQWSDTQLAVKFAAGERLANPALGLMIGTLAPWYEGEPATVTMGRYLKPVAPFTNPYRPKPYYLSPVVAAVNPASNVLSLEMANCLPEDGPDGDKFNLGTITIGMRQATPPGVNPATNTNPVVPLGTLVNDRETYLSQGGMYDIPLNTLPPATLALVTNDAYEMVLQTGLSGVLLAETPYMVATDVGCAYLDDLPPGESWDDPAVRAALARKPDVALRGELDLLVRYRGRVPNGTTPLRVEQWKETPTGYVNQFGVYRYPVLLHTETVDVAGATGHYRLRPLQQSGLRLYRFVPPQNFPQDIAPDTLANMAFQEFFAELRVLPYDDYSAVGDAELTFPFIYQEIFRYYYLILPAMSERLDMSDPTVWQSPTAARYVLRMIDERLWSYYNYMPRTRDLSTYRRQLLRRFCNKVLAENGIVQEIAPARRAAGKGAR